jgi:hypothetical protein
MASSRPEYHDVGTGEDAIFPDPAVLPAPKRPMLFAKPSPLEAGVE